MPTPEHYHTSFAPERAGRPSPAELPLSPWERVAAKRPGEGSHDQARAHVAHQEEARRISPRELTVAVRQLATLLRAGMPLVPALAALLEQCHNQPLAPVLRDLHRDVSAGATLADACSRHGHVFSRLFVSLVQAGETGGCLEDVLLRLAAMLEKRNRLANRLKVAFAYPAMMCVVSVAVVIFLMAFVVPSLAAIFTEMDRDLPLPTELLIGASTFLRSNALFLALGLLALVFIAVALLRDETRRRTLDALLLRVPGLGRLLLQIEAARLARTLGTLLAGGVNLLDALDITRAVVQNRAASDALAAVRPDVQHGQTLARALGRTNLFEPIFLHTVAVGELSGNLANQLLNLADNAEEEIETLSKSALALLEPAILLIMAVFVGFIVIAILLPIFEINQML